MKMETPWQHSLPLLPSNEWLGHHLTVQPQINISNISCKRFSDQSPPPRNQWSETESHFELVHQSRTQIAVFLVSGGRKGVFPFSLCHSRVIKGKTLSCAFDTSALEQHQEFGQIYTVNSCYIHCIMTWHRISRVCSAYKIILTWLHKKFLTQQHARFWVCDPLPSIHKMGTSWKPANRLKYPAYITLGLKSMR